MSLLTNACWPRLASVLYSKDVRLGQRDGTLSFCTVGPLRPLAPCSDWGVSDDRPRCEAASICAGSAFPATWVLATTRRRGLPTQRFAASNRKTPTPAEKELARILRENWPGVEWIPQWAFGGKWILDFYFRTAEVGVEVDGEYHQTAKQMLRDEAKARACAARNIVLVRVTNAEVFGDRDLLFRKIREAFVRSSQMRRSRERRT